MGEHKTYSPVNEKDRIHYINHLLDDLKSLEYMLEHGMIEHGIIRVGAEQEFCLVNSNWRPATNAQDILAAINDEHFTTELAKYNIEINLDPFKAEGAVFQDVKNQLTTLLDKAHKASNALGSKVVLTGILPSISLRELSIDFMTPAPRYYALNEMLLKNRGADFRLQLNGVDELAIAHDTVMFEACNTSFQLHLQIDPDDFESTYNWAQAITGPVLAAAVNSPLLLGKELWSETRIALFQQSIDTRQLSRAHVDHQARVSFGEDWVRGSILDHYKNELSRFPVLLTRSIEHNSYQEVLAGKTPKLQALNLHNGTVYRWNRTCYGVGGGKAHLRIENRYIPSGPTVEDEIANFVFWVGLMSGRTAEHEQLWEKMDFKDAKSNFIRAATVGADAVMYWMGVKIPVKQLILEELIPLAESGLKKLKVDSADSAHYLGLIADRVRSHNGAEWTVTNYRNLRKRLTTDQALLTLTKGIYDHQWSGKEVAKWPNMGDVQAHEHHVSSIGHIMTTTVITANQNDSARLIIDFMRWNTIHHLPVVDDRRNLVGIITWSHLDTHWKQVIDADNMLSVKDIMIKKVVTVDPSTSVPDAMALARQHNIGCLPVIQNDQLVGIITHRDIRRVENA